MTDDTVYTLDETKKENLRQLVSRIESLVTEKKKITGWIKEVYDEAKAFGYDTKVIRAYIKRRAENSGERDTFEMLLDAYMAALDFKATPLGSAISSKFDCVVVDKDGKIEIRSHSSLEPKLQKNALIKQFGAENVTFGASIEGAHQ